MVLINATHHNYHPKMLYTIKSVLIAKHLKHSNNNCSLRFSNLQFGSFSKAFTTKLPENVSSK
jgi:hypothetical protein